MHVLTMAISALGLFASLASANPVPDDAGQSLARRFHPNPPAPPSTAPQPGAYVITNMANEKLAITYNSHGTPLTVTPSESGSVSQRWLIVNGKLGQSVKPVDDIGLEAAWGKSGVTLLPSEGFIWTIKKTANGYTIQDTGETSSWGLESATDNTWVTLVASTSDATQKWRFDKVG